MISKFLTAITFIGLLILGGYTFLKSEPNFDSQIRTLIDTYVTEAMKGVQNLGGDTFIPGGLATYTISGSGVSSSATSITLNSLTIPQTGQKLVDADFSDTFYLTLEPGNRTRQEFVSCTTVVQNASTATLSGCSRGLSPISPYTASTTLQFAHAGGTQLIFSNSPQFYNQFVAKANDEDITGLYTFNTVLPTSSLTATTSAQLTTKGYVDTIANQGAATSSETLGGISELATQIEMASSTDLGVTRPLVLQAKYATSSPGYAGLWTVVTDNAGKIAQAFLDLTASFTLTGNWTFNAGGTATTTFNRGVDIDADSDTPLIINTQPYVFPTSDGTASSTALFTNGSGNLTWNYPSMRSLLVKGTVESTQATASTTYAEIAISGNTLSTGSILRFSAIPATTDGGSGSAFYCLNIGTGSATTTLKCTQDTGGGFIEGQIHFHSNSSQSLITTVDRGSVTTSFLSASLTLSSNIYIEFEMRTSNGIDTASFKGAHVELINN